MTSNLVTVNVTMLDSSGNPSQGTWLFAASGTLMDANYIAIVAPVVKGSIDAAGHLQFTNTSTGVVSEGAVLLASDNYPLGDLSWNFFGRFRDMPAIHVQDMQINFSAGPTQNLFSILAANGWVPESI